MDNEEQERKSKKFWAVNETWEVKHVTGYECPPNEDTWWVPELGYSLNTKYHLFNTEAKARRSAIDKLQKQINYLQAELSRLHLENH